jgi:hypothetical protein
VGKDVRGDQDRDEGAQRHLRQVAGEVGLQPLDALGRRRGELAGALAHRVRRSEAEYVRQKVLPHLCLRPHSSPLGHHLLDPYQRGPHRHGAEESEQQSPDVPQAFTIQEDPVDYLAQEHHLRHGGGGHEQTHHDRGHQIDAHGPDSFEQVVVHATTLRLSRCEASYHDGFRIGLPGPQRTGRMDCQTEE